MARNKELELHRLIDRLVSDMRSMGISSIFIDVDRKEAELVYKKTKRIVVGKSGQ